MNMVALRCVAAERLEMTNAALFGGSAWAEFPQSARCAVFHGTARRRREGATQPKRLSDAPAKARKGEGREAGQRHHPSGGFGDARASYCNARRTVQPRD